MIKLPKQSSFIWIDLVFKKFFSRSEQGKEIVEETEDYREESEFITTDKLVRLIQHGVQKYCMRNSRPKSCPSEQFRRLNAIYPLCLRTMRKKTRPG